MLVLLSLIVCSQATPLLHSSPSKTFFQQKVHIRQTPEEPVVVEGIPLQLDCHLESASEKEASSASINDYAKIEPRLNYQWPLN